MHRVLLPLLAGVLWAVTLAAAPAVRIESPYSPRAHAYKGQLHAHSTLSDGKDSPEAMVKAYHDAGFNFLALTDHNWKGGTFRSAPAVFKHGYPDFLLLPAFEVSSLGRSKFLERHMLAIGVDLLSPRAGPLEYLRGIDAVQGFAVLCHPTWKGREYWPRREMLDLPYHALEHSQSLWDHLLSRGKRLFLVNTDDAHSAKKVGRGFVTVFADRLERRAVLDALRAGNYFASTGPAFTRLAVRDGEIVAESKEIGNFDFVIFGGHPVHRVDNTNRAAYRPIGDETYVRVRLFDPVTKKMACSMPFWVR